MTRKIRQTRKSESGFSLVEVLVALTILSVAAASLIGVGESHVQRLDRLETRAAAQWIAENKLAELRLGGLLDEGPNIRMIDRDWQVEVRYEATSDPDLQKAVVSVFESSGGAEDAPAANLTSFIDSAERLR